MELVGKEVIHPIEYGRGIIVKQTDKYVFVEFEAGERQFEYPKCFKSFLQLVDSEAAEFVDGLNQQLDETKAQIEEEKKKQEKKAEDFKKKAAMETKSKEKETTMPTYSSLNEFFVDQKHAIDMEIAYLLNNGGKRTKLFEGKLVETKNEKYIYSFDSDSELNLPDNTQISLWPNDKKESIPAVAVNCEEFNILIETSRFLGQSVNMIEFSAEAWRLLSSLNERLETIINNPTKIVEDLICAGRYKIQPGTKIKRGQETACQMSLEQPITFVWGPPGTGKTETLAKLALKHMEQGRRVLMLSYSNVSVDGALWRVFNKSEKEIPGKIVRYGYPRDKRLLEHEYLTSYKLTLKTHPELRAEREKLLKLKKNLAKSSPQYLATVEKLAKIKEMLADEEKKAVKQASFVATTVSKAIVDRTLYDDHYDVVIFDEASMAYIPQVVFSASLASNHFICMGDFAQLPPIVQSSNSSILNIDIFQYCGIVDAVERNGAHQWLCLLDTQYRMHPKIAQFSSDAMYHGLLKSGDEMEKKRESITKEGPFSGNALQLVDLTGMMSACKKTADNSRINVLSAIVAMGLAVQVAGKNEVGIITPYNAQARLMHAMSRDVLESQPQLQKITCATVHQFQGSEKDVIIYDAVDCYRMQYPGMLLSSMTNNYANRLYNVALTRAKGKMISIVDVDYMKTKKLSSKLIFRKMINRLSAFGKKAIKNEIISEMDRHIIKNYQSPKAESVFLEDLQLAKKEILIDIPRDVSSGTDWVKKLCKHIDFAKGQGVKVRIRVDKKESVPHILHPYVIENPYITDPVALIDRKRIWYGMPTSGEHFPIFQIESEHFARSLYGFLEMGNSIDLSESKTPISDGNGKYNTFASYVSGELKCPDCGEKLKLRKSKKGRFFFSCSAYPKCKYARNVEKEDVNNYFYFESKKGKHCPQDHTSLEPRLGKYGIYVSCCAMGKHFYNLDEV